MTSRRDLLATLGAGVTAAGLAGCNAGDEATTTATPTPAASAVTVRVENEDDQPHGVLVKLTSRTPDVDRICQFEVADVEPGATGSSDRWDLEPGRYEVTLEFDLGNSTIRWAGHECADKLLVVRFVEDGVVVGDRCPPEE